MSSRVFNLISFTQAEAVPSSRFYTLAGKKLNKKKEKLIKLIKQTLF